ncbi:hypothetical protein F5883DRAFT_419322, partial [Diaporthe sp. PMI_573]
YLRNANPNNMTLASWSSGGGWNFTHGETRSASKHTFHLGFRQDSQGHYRTCIAVETARNTNVPIEGTLVDWGTDAPEPGAVLAHYQQLLNVRPLYPYQGPNQGGNNNGNGGNGGGAGSSTGGGGSGASKQVFNDDYGGYYYSTEEEPYVACDAQGNSLGILTVYVDATNKAYYYSNGRTTRGTLTKDPKTQKTSFIDQRGQLRRFRYVGKETHYRRSIASRSAYPASNGGSTGYSQPHTDPRTGQQYYVGSDGKTHWKS